MRKTLVALIAIPIVLLIMLASCLGVVTSSQESANKDEDCSAEAQASAMLANSDDTYVPESFSSQLGIDALWYIGKTVKDAPMDKDQADIAAKIASIVRGRKDIPAEHKQRATIIALITGIVESMLVNLSYGDRDSAGVFQQRPSQGWGTFDQVTNVVYATNKFLDAMVAHPGWKTGEFGTVAADVQRPAEEYRYRYQEHVTEAQKIYSALGGVTSTSSYVVACSDDRIERAVIAALAMTGSPYTWKAENRFDGVGFVQSAFGAAGIKLPSTMTELASYAGETKIGIKASFISGDKFKKSEQRLTRGDIVMMSEEGGSEPADVTSVGVFVGSSTLESVNVATYNMKTGKGYQARINRARKLADERGWDVIGFQEVESKPIYAALKSAFSTGPWEVYPSKAKHPHRNGAQARTIAYNSERFEVVGTDEILFERMKADGDRQPAHAPVVRLRDKASGPSGQEFYVANTHSSAYPRFALERKQAAEAYVQKMEALKATGVPVIFTGDFNSGFWTAQKSPLPTWEGDRSNLAYCQLTKNGLMQNAKDVFDGIASRGGGYCPRRRGEGQGMIDHIYVTPGVEVSEFGTVDRSVTLSDHRAVHAVLNLPGGASSESNQGGKGKDDGFYVGPDQNTGIIGTLPVRSRRLVGVVRLSIVESSGAEAIAVDGDWTLPVKKGTYLLTARFGECGVNWSSCHTGLDFAGDAGSTVYAASAGEVVSAEYAGAYGNRIIIKRPDGSETWYCHLDSFDVESGNVEAGTPIAKTGETGNTTGPHLHFEVRTAAGDAVDPYDFLVSQGLNP